MNDNASEQVIKQIIEELMDEKFLIMKQELKQELRKEITEAFDVSISRQTEVIKSFMQALNNNYERLEERVDRLDGALFA